MSLSHRNATRDFLNGLLYFPKRSTSHLWRQPIPIIPSRGVCAVRHRPDACKRDETPSIVIHQVRPTFLQPGKVFGRRGVGHDIQALPILVQIIGGMSRTKTVCGVW